MEKIRQHNHNSFSEINNPETSIQHSTKQLSTNFFHDHWVCFSEINKINHPENKDLVEFVKNKISATLQNDKIIVAHKDSLNSYSLKFSQNFTVQNISINFTMTIYLSYINNKTLKILISSPHEFIKDLPIELKEQENFKGAYKSLWKGVEIICSTFDLEEYVINQTPIVYMRIANDDPKFQHLTQYEFNNEENPYNDFQLITINHEPIEILAIDQYKGIPLKFYLENYNNINKNNRIKLAQSLLEKFFVLKGNIEQNPNDEIIENPVLDIKISNTLYCLSTKQINIIDVSNEVSTLTCLKHNNQGDYSSRVTQFHSIKLLNTNRREVEILGLASILLAIFALNKDNYNLYISLIYYASHSSEEYNHQIREKLFEESLEKFIATVNIPKVNNIAEVKAILSEMITIAFNGVSDYSIFEQVIESIAENFITLKRNKSNIIGSTETIIEADVQQNGHKLQHKD